MKPNTILLVEDNESDIELTKRALRKNKSSHELVVAEDGQEALDILLGITEDQDMVASLPVLILLDINLPRINGLEVLRRLRADPRTHRLPVVILTSSIIEHDIATSYDLGANSYLRKPIDFTQFQDLISHLVRYWLEFNIRPPQTSS
jgi:two-component system response regulator